MNKNIEAIYPLSPMQQGMLFHTLLEDSSPAYLQQLSCRLAGRLDRESFRRAWAFILGRHAALRSVFVWEKNEQPLQAVLREVPLRLEELDWRGLGPDEQRRRLDELLDEDRRRGFVLTQAPLMRLALVRLGEELYRFVWSHHHLLLDGWSTGRVLSEFRQAYGALAAGRRPSLPPVTPYRDYIGWLGRQGAGPAETFWRESLEGFGAPTPLVVDRKPKAAGADGGERFAELRRDLPEELRRSLVRQASEHRLTLNDLVTGAWALLLWNYSGEEDVLFGVTVSGRPPELAGVETMVGLFINTLPLRLPVRGDDNLLAWLRALQARQLDIRRFEHCSLTDIQAQSEVPRGTPLFQSIVVHENYPLSPASDLAGGIALEDVDLYERSNYPLTLIVDEQGEGLHLRLFYESARFEPHAAARLLAHLTTLLDGMAGALAESPASSRLRDLPLLAGGELRELLREWNATSADYERGARIHELFERRAGAAPEAVAVCDGLATLTYREVDEEANRIAHLVGRLGLGPGDFIAVYLSRSAAVVPALLGVLKSGAAYVPLEATYPDARLEHIFSQLGVTCVLTQSAHLPRLDALASEGLRHFVCLDAGASGDDGAGRAGAGRRRLHGRDELARMPVSGPARDIPSDGFAYVIFTSGSTGAPKGVVVRHRPVVNLIEWVNRRFRVGPSDRVLFITSLCFDLSVYDVFGLLAAGGSVRVVGEAELQDPERLTRLLCDEPVTFWDSAPAALQQLVPFLPAGGAPRSRLRLVFVSGDWVPLGLPRSLRDCFRGVEVVALGGATEATVWSNFFPVGEVDPGWSSIPYGRPIQNATYFVLDRWQRPCPVGVPGDLYIGGECLATGYAGLPAMTAERFIPDPFAAAPGARLYRTGDRARFFADGTIEFLGRVDRQVKVRGFRIELGEIEAVLARHANVRDAQIVVRKDRTGEQQLIAYVVTREPSPAAADELKSHLRDYLPPYMIPSAVCLIEAVPLTANGKVDLKALPPPEACAEPSAGQAPPDQLEELIGGVWAEVLGRERVGVGENFFELGGHSLHATQVVARLRGALGVELQLRTLFEEPTVAGLASACRLLRGGPGPQAPPLVPVPRPGASELSFSQSRLWFLNRVQPDSPFYNVPLAVRLEGALDVDALSRCVNEVVRRHEVLRTSYRVEGGRPVQTVAPEAKLTPSLVDLRGMPAGEREAAAARQLDEAVRRRFDLEKDILLGVTLWRLEEDRHLLLLLTHHIASDGWSMGVLIRELAELYRAAREGEEPGLAPLPVQYADYAAWERSWLRGEVLERQLGYWRGQLAGAPPLLLPTDAPRPEVLSFSGRTLHFTLPDKLTADLRALAAQEDVTLFMALLTAFSVLLGWRSGQRDVVVGTDVANRGRAEVEGLVGFFVNQLVLRCDLGGEPTVRELLRRLRSTTLDAYTHQHVPFEELVRLVNPERDAGRMPLFQTKLVLQNAPAAEVDLPGLRLLPVRIETGTAKYDLLLTFEDSTPLSGRLEYSSDLFETSTIERLLGHYRHLLEQMTLNPKLTLRQLHASLAETEREHTSRRERELRLAGIRKLRDIRRAAGPA